MFFTSTVSKLIVKGAFWRTALLFAGMFVLLSVAGLSSSSEADEPLFTRSAQQLERLWSGVLGCTHPGEDGVRGTFETTFNGGGAPSAVDHDYVECGKRALRNTSSHMLVDTIEDAVRSGGVALFSENFHLDSSVGWVWDEKVSGEFDAVIPLFSKERYNGLGYAFFLQPGGVFWQGLKNQDRIDGNLGLAFRSNLTRDIIAGGSVFYDYDFRREHQRAGVGLDLQSGALHTALNYYHPLNDWQEGRTDYEEQPLQGADFRLGLAWSRIRFDTSVAVWRFEREEEESTKWRPAFGIDAGYRILPGVFLEGGYESHDSDDSLDSRWNAGLAFRFSLPGLKGVKSYETMAEANLWEPVAREKRILYEEREAIPIIRLVPTGDDGQPLDGATIEEGGTAVIAGQLVALPMPVTYELAIDDTSTAELGVDFRYGHRVYELDEETGEQSAPEETTNCPEVTCEMTIPAEITRFEVEVELLDETETAPELQEEIVLRVNVPEEHQRDVRSNETRVTIEANNNVVMFDDSNSDDEFVEADDTATAETEHTAMVTVGINMPSPSPIELTVTPGGEATEGQDYALSTRTLQIPANASSVVLGLSGIDDQEGEGNESIELTLSGTLPPGWSFGPAADPDSPPDTITHNLTLRDDDLVVGFTSSRTTVEENIGAVELMVGPNQTLTGAAVIEWSVTAGADELTNATTTSGTFNFAENEDETDLETITLNIMDDGDAENATDVTVTLTATTLPEGWSLGRETHTVTIEPSDGAIAFTPTDAITANEGDTVQIGLRSTVDGPSGGYPVTISIPNASGEISFPATVTLPAGQRAHTFSITIERDNTPESAETFTMSLSSGRSDDWTVSGSRTITIPLNEGRISFAHASATAVEAGASATTTVTVSPAPASQVTIPINVAATGGVDYTLRAGGAMVTDEITVGTSGSVSLTLAPVRDRDTRGGTVTVSLGTPLPNGYTPGAPNSWAVTVNDNNTNIEPERTVAFEDSSTTVLEGGSSVTTTLVVTPSPGQGSQVAIPVTVTTENNETDSTLMAGSTTITESTTEIIVDDTGTTTLTLSASNDSDDEGGKITVSIGTPLPELYTAGSRNTWTGIIWDKEADAINFSPTSLTYGDAAIVGTISTSATGGFPAGATLFVGNSDERGAVIATEAYVTLPAGEANTTTQIVPRGGTGDVTLTLADPEGTLPFDWRIGEDNTLTLTRATPRTANNNTISIYSNVGNRAVEGSALELIVEAYQGSGSTAIPSEGINLSLKVESVYLEPKTETDPITGVVTHGEDEEPGSKEPALLISPGHQPGFRRVGVSQPNPLFPGFPGMHTVEPENEYTFKLTQEHPDINVFALIDEDDIVEVPERITITLAAEGTLPNGWTLGTSTHEITIPADGSRVGFASNLPDRALEGLTIKSPSSLAMELRKGVDAGSARDLNFINLPFQSVYPMSSQTTLIVEVDGYNSAGSPLSSEYRDHIEITGQVPTSNPNAPFYNAGTTRSFSINGTGKLHTTNIGFRVFEDSNAELAQRFVVTVQLKGMAQFVGGTEIGTMTHEITVLPSDNTITFSAPQSGSGGTTDIPVSFNNPIPVQTQADMDDNIPLPSIVIKPADASVASSQDYALSVSAGTLVPESNCTRSGELGNGEDITHTWTPPTAAAGATLTVTSCLESGSRVLMLDSSATNALLGWDVSGGTHTSTITLGQ